MAGPANFCLTRSILVHQFAQIAHGRVDFLQVAPAPFAGLAIQFAHQADHVAEVTNLRLGQVAFSGAFCSPGRDLINLRLEPAQISPASPAQSAPETNEIGKQ